MSKIKNDEKIIKKEVVLTMNVKELIDKGKVSNTSITKGQIRYRNLINSIWAYIFDDYKRKDNFVKVYFGGVKSTPQKYIYLTCIEFLEHLMFWKMHVIYAAKNKIVVPIEEDDFYDLSEFDKRLYSTIMNNLMDKFIDKVENNYELSYYISLINDDFVELAEACSYITANTFSLWDIIQLMKREKDFRRSINTVLDERKSPSELERQLRLGEQVLIETILRDGKSAMVPFIKSKRINHDQFTQMFYAVGPRTDIDKTVLPVIMKGNYLKGYNDSSEYYIDAITGRDAQIAKHTNVRLSGYLSRKINLGCLATYIDYSVKDCGTPNYLEYYIKDKDWLRSIHKKYMILPTGKLYLINGKKDTHLIGQMVRIRSHICCALTDDKICQTCFGGKSKSVYGTRVGGLPAIKLANPLSKRIMRQKHFTSTNTMEIVDKNLEKFFKSESSKLFFQKHIPDKNLYIVVDRDYVEEIVQGSVDIDEEGIDVALPLESVTIRQKYIDRDDKDDKEYDDYLIECDGLFLTFTDELLEAISKMGKGRGAVSIFDSDSDEAEIPINRIDKDAPVFNMVIVTEEVSRYLKQVMKLMDSVYTRNYTNTYSDTETGLSGYNLLVHDILEILIDSGLSGTSVTHTETVVHHLLRIPDKLYERPNFAIKDPYYIPVPLKQSILKRDLLTALSFQEFKTQVTDSDSFIKNSSGVFDQVYKTKRASYLEKIDPALIAKVMAQ